MIDNPNNCECIYNKHLFLSCRTEEEIGTDDLKSLEIPSDLVEKFNNMDKEFLEDK